MLNNQDVSLAPSTRPGDVPGWDSLANVNIVFAVEEDFGIRFTDHDLREIGTVGDLASRVEAALERQRRT